MYNVIYVKCKNIFFSWINEIYGTIDYSKLLKSKIYCDILKATNNKQSVQKYVQVFGIKAVSTSYILRIETCKRIKLKFDTVV